MAEDQRWKAAHFRSQKQASCASKWAPGAWKAAREAESLELPFFKRCPVIISADGMMKTPGDLCDFLNLPSVPPITETTKVYSTTVGEREGEQDKATFQITDIDSYEWLDLKRRTEGKTVLLWFQGGKRSAWFAQSPKIESDGRFKAEHND